jgi:hypothetical protein
MNAYRILSLALAAKVTGDVERAVALLNSAAQRFAAERHGLMEAGCKALLAELQLDEQVNQHGSNDHEIA